MEIEDFLVRSIVRDISFKKQEMIYVTNKLARFAGIAPVYFGSGGKVRNIIKASREIGRCTLYFTTWQYNKYK